MEKWSRWYPIPNIGNQYYFTNINNTNERLHITLRDLHDECIALHVTFIRPIAAYRVTEEGLTLSILDYLDETHGGTNFYSAWNFFKIDSSNYINQLLKQLPNAAHVDGLQHFVIFTSDELVEVVSKEEPTFKLITKF